MPLGFSEKEIFSVLEWDISTYYDEYGEATNGGYYILPRFNHYQLAERPESEPYEPQSATKSQLEKVDVSNTDKSSNLGYTIVNPQAAATSTSKH